jgi:hypothetical protein
MDMNTSLLVAKLGLRQAIAVALITGGLSITGTIVAQSSIFGGKQVYCRIRESDLTGTISMVTEIMKKSAEFNTAHAQKLFGEIFSSKFKLEPDGSISGIDRHEILVRVNKEMTPEFNAVGTETLNLATKLKVLMDLFPLEKTK